MTKVKDAAVTVLLARGVERTVKQNEESVHGWVAISQEDLSWKME